MYTVQGKDFVATDVTSLTQLMEIASNQWVWVDIYDPNEKEREIISELLGNEPEIVEKFKKRMGEPLNIHLEGYILCSYEKIHEYVSVTIPSITLDEQMRVYPIVLAKKKKIKGWVIFPNNDDAVYVLSRYKNALSEYYRIPTPSWDVIKNIHIKKNTYQLAEKHGIPIPKTYYPRDLQELLAWDLEFPLVIKPSIKEIKK